MRAKYPSSGWWRLASSSVITTTGSTTSCSSKRVNAAGSASSTLVSRTNVRPGPRDVSDVSDGVMTTSCASAGLPLPALLLRPYVAQWP